jgi:SNF2 family DNA or RNA helicase
MNLLQVPFMILGDDTGLGKTIEVLSAIGYIWLKEPTYVPIVITKKSSLFQWETEVHKFMKGMEAVTVDAQPFERAAIYEDFFLNYDPNRKRLIILTYDMLLKDTDEAVIRDRTTKGELKDRKALKAVRKALREEKEKLDQEFQIFKNHFNDRPPEFFGYVKARMAVADEDAESPEQPTEWDEKDEKRLTTFYRLRQSCEAGEAQVERLKDLVAPPLRTPGIYGLVREMQSRHPDVKLMFIVDEVHTLKNYKGKMHKAAARLAAVSDRVVGMTATAVKNRLMEFFGLYKLVLPSLFPKVTHFQNRYCIIKWQKISKNRRVPIVVGHSNAQLDAFVDWIEPYYLSRRKHEVAEELPQLVTRELICELSEEQEELYSIAELGLLNKAEDADASPAEMLSSMVMVQQACNAPQLLMDEDGNPFEGTSSKLSILQDLFTEDLVGVKTIVFSRFERMISLIEDMLNKAEVKCVRITGKETKAKDRQASMKAFQDISSGVDVILVTTAGSESINLQAAEHIVFVDSPWSWGDYVQLTGRAIRIGSQHVMVVSTHLIARRRSGTKTIDDYVIKTLRGKKRLADTVAGESLQDGLRFTGSNDAMDIFNMMRAALVGKTEILPEDRKAIQSSARKAVKPRSKKKTPKAKVKKTPERKEPALFVPDMDFSDI